jgi:hypothetical protein
MTGGSYAGTFRYDVHARRRIFRVVELFAEIAEVNRAKLRRAYE